MVQTGSDWIRTQMRQILDFFRSESSTFWLGEPKCTEIWSERVQVRICPKNLIWKSPGFVPFGGQSDPLLVEIRHLWKRWKWNVSNSTSFIIQLPGNHSLLFKADYSTVFVDHIVWLSNCFANKHTQKTILVSESRLKMSIPIVIPVFNHSSFWVEWLGEIGQHL